MSIRCAPCSARRLLMVLSLGSAALVPRPVVAQDGPIPLLLAVDTKRSEVAFALPMFGGVASGRAGFEEYEIALRYDEERVWRSTLLARIRTRSLSTGIGRIDARLMAPDFLDAAGTPTITFVSERVTGNPEQFIVHGRLYIRGHSRSIALPVRRVARVRDAVTGAVRYEFRATTQLLRRSLAPNWQPPKAMFVAEMVEVELRIVTR